MNDPGSIFAAGLLIQIVIALAFMTIGVLLLAFWIWMLVDCLKYESSEGNDKIVWTLVIIFTNWIGAMIYFFVRRLERVDAKARVRGQLKRQ